MKRKVRVTGPGIKLNNVWCYINEEAVIDEKQYKENEKYVEVIEEIEETKTEEVKTAAPAVQTETVEEKKQEDNNPESNEKTENDEQTEDEELDALKEKAKELGIKNAHNMKKETLIARIEEAKAGEGQNPEGE